MQTELLLVFLLSIIIVVSGMGLTAAAAIGTLDKTSTMTTLSPSRQALADFNFAAVGDWGCTSHTIDTIKNIQNRDPELVLALGDLSCEKTGNCWLNETRSINNKLKIAIGNHDYDDDKKGDATLLQIQYKKHFGLSNTYYSFDYYNVHFIAIDSMLPYTINSAQYSFVRNDLISTSQNPDIKWIIVYFHHPMYTSASEHSSDLLLRATYHPLFDQYGVDLVLQGHNHNYQRSYPITISIIIIIIKLAILIMIFRLNQL